MHCYRFALTMKRKSVLPGCLFLAMHRMMKTRIRVVVDLVGQRRPDLPGMLVGDGDQHLAEGQARID